MEFQWNQFAFIYSNLQDEQTCEIMKNELEVKSNFVSYSNSRNSSETTLAVS